MDKAQSSWKLNPWETKAYLSLHTHTSKVNHDHKKRKVFQRKFDILSLSLVLTVDHVE